MKDDIRADVDKKSLNLVFYKIQMITSIPPISLPPFCDGYVAPKL